jgi:hypothetical protein
MSDGRFFAFIGLCALAVGGMLYLFRFQDSRPVYIGYERPTVRLQEDPNDPGWFNRPHTRTRK